VVVLVVDTLVRIFARLELLDIAVAPAKRRHPAQRKIKQRRRQALA
jgi:hypothetical protein